VGGFKVELADESDMFDWTVHIEGPPDSFYETGVFKCQMRFPQDYPNSPPSLRFISDFWHPNVYQDGRVCISILHQPDPYNPQESPEECWRPIQTVESILVSVISMLADPNFSSPANVDASVELRKSPEAYRKRVTKLVDKSKKELPSDFVMPKPKKPVIEVPDEAFDPLDEDYDLGGDDDDCDYGSDVDDDEIDRL